MEKTNYQPPEIAVIGTVSELTMASHAGTVYDGGPFSIPPGTPAGQIPSLIPLS